MKSSPLALLALLAGCGALDADPHLTKFESCEDMRSYMEDMALREARYRYAFDFDFFGGVASADFALNESAAPRGAVIQSDGTGADEFSTTNVQEEGIDEADLVETDGQFIYALAGNTLVTTLAWPIEDAMELSRVTIGAFPTGMYLYDDTVVVLSEAWPWDGTMAPLSGARLPEPGQNGRTVVTVIDVTDRTDPVVVRETWLEGELRSSRRIDERLYVVSYLDAEVSTGNDWETTLPEVKAAIREADPSDWLPWQVDSVRTGDGWDTTRGTACGCTDVWSSNRETGTLFTNVLSLDLSDPTSSFAGEGVVGEADVLYASSGALYVSYSETPDGLFRSLDDQLDTIVHKFDISDKAAHPKYVDTAQILGVVPDQFAFSEYRGVLRMATTDTDTFTTHVWTLEERDGKLERLDHLGGLAPGEELYSARFVGKIGYLVTYEVANFGVDIRDIQFGDPLFTLDLSDPSHIVAVGELVMNGWSDYIHPMDEGHLLTVGMDEDTDGRWKVAVSLFDVTDLSNPILADREILDAFSSEATEEHLAFNYFAPHDVLAMPSVATDGSWVLEVLHADTEGVSSVGRVRQDSVDEASADPWCGRIRRSVFLEDNVWAVSESGLTAAHIDAPEVELNAIPFEGLDSCWWSWGWGYNDSYYYGYE